MIQFQTGDLLASNAEALVNTVNCVGIMGRGVALQFKQQFPANFRAYEAACRRGEVQPGRMFVTETGQFAPKWIINFPTKRHWRGASRIEDIEAGLAALVDVVQVFGIRSVALPPLGSGLGGLDWVRVRPLIERSLGSLPETEVLVFEPRPTNDPVPFRVRDKPPVLSAPRAALIALIDRYQRGLMQDSATLLEVQKLGYFLQEAGQAMRLQFVKGLYGPYAQNLRFVLRDMEGYHTAGYGDGGDEPNKTITLVPGALAEADEVIAKGPATTRDRLSRVTRLVEGFETPVGLELLATAHWVATREGAGILEEAERAFKAWNARKSGFTSRQIGIALDRLREEDWIPAAA